MKSGYRLFPIHILIKDLSFMTFYFVIMKYNLTGETNLDKTFSNLQATKMNFLEMIKAAIFYNIVPMGISLALYFPIVYGFSKLIGKRNLRLIITGFILTMTTPILYFILNRWVHNDYYQTTAEVIAWGLCFTASLGFYYFVNREDHSPV